MHIDELSEEFKEQVGILSHFFYKTFDYMFPQHVDDMERKAEILGVIATLYSVPNRHYHTLEHINNMMLTIASLCGRSPDPSVGLTLAMINNGKPYDTKVSESEYHAMIFAAIFHDIVYCPEVKHELTDEEQSAMVALETIDTNGPFNHMVGNFSGMVESLILMTIDHDLSKRKHISEASAKIFLDADLQVIGSGGADYVKYCDNIRKEYIHVPINEYYFGRSNFLKKMLDKDVIFHTKTMNTLLEKDARENMKLELNALDKEAADSLLKELDEL